MRRIFFFLPLLAVLLLVPPSLTSATGPGGLPSVSAPADDDDSAAVAIVEEALPEVSDDSAAVAIVEEALPEVSDDEALAAAKTLLDYQSSPWGAIAAALLTLLIFVVRKLGLLNKFPKAALPWVAAGVAMAADVAAALSADAPVPDALLQGLMLGAAAVGFWEMALKHALGEKKGAEQERPK